MCRKAASNASRSVGWLPEALGFDAFSCFIGRGVPKTSITNAGREGHPVTVRTFRQTFGYTDLVLKRKPVRMDRQDLRDLATYTIPEAATFLAIPRRTMADWFGPQRLFKASANYGGYSLLSFRDIAEAYMLYVLREHHRLPTAHIKRALQSLRKESDCKHPLLDLDIRVFANSLILDKPPRGERSRELVNLSSHGRQLALGPVIDVFSKRILQDHKGQPSKLFPWRLFAQDNESRPVSIDPDVMSGRLVVTGTRIPVSVVVGMSLRNKTPEEIGKNYNITPDLVRKALLHIERPIQKVT